MAITVKNMLDAKGREVVTASPRMTLHEVAELLDEKKIGAIVIAGDDGRIAGIFTERDLVRSIARHGSKVLEQPVSSAMTTNVHRCREETTVDELMGLMTGGRFRHVPVEKGGKLVGIISIGDVVKSRIREVELEAEHMKAYIAG